ncbi:MAG: hypothetical protein A2148_08695 [Chloroflexi bacterium RBG_16_68_14]|nr:MAG: hypothetical protein A2148_08695 [Chloroflexi bacterium RBG_16_68_14]
MEPRIQYAKTSDGVSIAYCSLGEGPPLVDLELQPFTHIQLHLQNASWNEALGANRRRILLDGRGTGLSQREVTDFSLDARVLDVEAVVDKLGIERFALLGLVSSGHVAIAYAARHPERVSHLILWGSYARRSDYDQLPRLRAVTGLIEQDWELFTETVAHVAYGWSEEESRRFASHIRECITPREMKAYTEAARDIDVTHLLPKIASPTLVLHVQEAPFPPIGMARDLASRIPDARMVVLEGTWLTVQGDASKWAAVLNEFLGKHEAATLEPAPDDIHTILFTDLTSSTALTQRLGDARAQELLRTHNTIVRDALREHSGQEIKHTGDGIMASFPSASSALHCAIAIQKAVEEHSVGAPRPVGAPLQIHIGLNAGEPVAEEQDLFGTAVQLARRICDKAEGGEILASDVVRQLVAGKGFLFADRGEAALRGFEDPVRLYELRWRA